MQNYLTGRNLNKVKKRASASGKIPKSPYDLFMEAQDIPVHRDIGVHKVQDLPLKPWKRFGGRGIGDPASRHRKLVGHVCRRSAGRGRA